MTGWLSICPARPRRSPHSEARVAAPARPATAARGRLPRRPLLVGRLPPRARGGVRGRASAAGGSAVDGPVAAAPWSRTTTTGAPASHAAGRRSPRSSATPPDARPSRGAEPQLLCPMPDGVVEYTQVVNPTTAYRQVAGAEDAVAARGDAACATGRPDGARVGAARSRRRRPPVATSAGSKAGAPRSGGRSTMRRLLGHAFRRDDDLAALVLLVAGTRRTVRPSIPDGRGAADGRFRGTSSSPGVRTMWLFDQDGLWGAFRIAHVIVGVMWMGLLWFFNFVQVPAFAEMDPAARNNALDKLTWRALWWFRWAAAATVAFGILIVGVESPDSLRRRLLARRPPASRCCSASSSASSCSRTCGWSSGRTSRSSSPTPATCRRAARRTPTRAAAARPRAMASRQNTIFSLPLLVFMVGASHFYNVCALRPGPRRRATRCVYLLVGLAIIAVLELNALGKISGRGNGGLNVIYETHKNAMYTGFGADRVLLPLRRDPAPELERVTRRARRRGARGATRSSRRAARST